MARIPERLMRWAVPVPEIKIDDGANSVSEIRELELQHPDTIVVHGEGNPLDQQRLNTLIETINDIGLVREGNTLYATEFVRQQDWQGVPGVTGDTSYVEFLERHYQEASRMLQKAHPELTGGIQLRRLVIVKDTQVDPPASWHSGFIATGPHDSDGTDGVWQQEPYIPTQSAYWDTAARLDRGKLHEMGHRIKHLPDLYSLDAYLGNSGANMPIDSISRINKRRVHEGELAFDAFLGEAREFSPDHALSGIPQAWLVYRRGHRNDGKGLMASNNTQDMKDLSEASAAYLKIRDAKEQLHDDGNNIPQGGWSFPSEDTSLRIVAKGFAGASVTVYRSDGSPLEKHFDNPPIETQMHFNDEDELVLPNPFGSAAENGMVPNYKGLLLLRATKPDGNESFRYIDIADVIAAQARNMDPETGVIPGQVTMNLMEGLVPLQTTQTPDQFNWAIAGELSQKVFGPIVRKSS